MTLPSWCFDPIRKRRLHFKRTFTAFCSITIALVFASVAYAYAASNTVPTSKAGDGAGAINGYTISVVRYNLNADSPQNIDSVTFTTNVIVTAGSTVKIKLVSAGNDWYTCTGQGSTTITCVTTSPQATVNTANSLRVVIAD